LAHFVRLITSLNIDKFSNFYTVRIRRKFRNNTITKDPTTPHMYRYSYLLKYQYLKATIENKTSVTTPAERQTLKMRC